MLKAKTLLSFKKRKGFRKLFCINFNMINLNNIELQHYSFKKEVPCFVFLPFAFL